MCCSAPTMRHGIGMTARKHALGSQSPLRLTTVRARDFRYYELRSSPDHVMELESGVTVYYGSEIG